MSTAVVDNDGIVRQLDARADAPVVLSAEDVQDADKLARLLNDARREIADLRRRWEPRRLIFQDRAVTAGADLRLEHGFGGNVLYTVEAWVAGTPGDAPVFEVSDDTDGNALVLEVGNSGTATILVKESG